MLPVLEGLQAGGATSLKAPAKRLNAMGHGTPRGKQSTGIAAPAVDSNGGRAGLGAGGLKAEWASARNIGVRRW